MLLIFCGIVSDLESVSECSLKFKELIMKDNGVSITKIDLCLYIQVDGEFIFESNKSRYVVSIAILCE